jgi:hypothetical protein
LSDFTDMADHGVSNAGAPLDHPLYHFAKEFEARRALKEICSQQPKFADGRRARARMYTPILGGLPTNSHQPNGHFRQKKVCKEKLAGVDGGLDDKWRKAWGFRANEDSQMR